MEIGASLHDLFDDFRLALDAKSSNLLEVITKTKTTFSTSFAIGHHSDRHDLQKHFASLDVYDLRPSVDGPVLDLIRKVRLLPSLGLVGLVGRNELVDRQATDARRYTLDVIVLLSAHPVLLELDDIDGSILVPNTLVCKVVGSPSSSKGPLELDHLLLCRQDSVLVASWPSLHGILALKRHWLLVVLVRLLLLHF